MNASSPERLVDLFRGVVEEDCIAIEGDQESPGSAPARRGCVTSLRRWQYEGGRHAIVQGYLDQMLLRRGRAGNEMDEVMVTRAAASKWWHG